MDEKKPVSAPAIGPLLESDVDEADKIMRIAFGTFLNLPDPMAFLGDADYVRTRFKAAPGCAFAAKVDGELAGSVFVSHWGSAGFFGPLTVHPRYWDCGIAGRLLAPVMDSFERRGTRLAGLFTFPHSSKHLSLYQKFGFWPRFLTSVLAKTPDTAAQKTGYRLFSSLDPARQEKALEECAELTGAVYEGLDVRQEILAAARQKLGDMVLSDGERLTGFAVCHTGKGTEAGSGTLYVKFAAARPGKHAARNFETLLAAAESFAVERRTAKLAAGCNAGCESAFRFMESKGFKRELTGVIMHRPNLEGLDRKDMYVLYDWR